LLLLLLLLLLWLFPPPHGGRLPLHLIAIIHLVIHKFPSNLTVIGLYYVSMEYYKIEFLFYEQSNREQ
jgi:hypothetical protein